MNVIRGFADRFKSKMTHLCLESHTRIDVGDRPSIYQPLELSPVRLTAHRICNWLESISLHVTEQNGPPSRTSDWWKQEKTQSFKMLTRWKREINPKCASSSCTERTGSNTTNCFISGKGFKKACFQEDQRTEAGGLNKFACAISITRTS